MNRRGFATVRIFLRTPSSRYWPNDLLICPRSPSVRSYHAVRQLCPGGLCQGVCLSSAAGTTCRPVLTSGQPTPVPAAASRRAMPSLRLDRKEADDGGSRYWATSDPQPAPTLRERPASGGRFQQLCPLAPIEPVCALAPIEPVCALALSDLWASQTANRRLLTSLRVRAGRLQPSPVCHCNC